MRILVLLYVLVIVLNAQMVYSDPNPSFENPRKMIVQISSDSEEDIHHILGSINNIIKEYPTGTIEVAVICYYNGIRVLQKNEIEEIKVRIKSLQSYDVEFIACENTMFSKKLTRESFIDNIGFVKAGLAEVLERVVAGWVNIRP